MKMFISPHCDDETLFGAFTILREKPLVVVVFDGYTQQNRGLNVTAEQRRDETRAAMNILGANVEFLGFRDDNPNVVTESIIRIVESLDWISPELIYAPAIEVDGHPQHNLVGRAFNSYKSSPVVQYLTYTSGGKSRWGREVKIESMDWIRLKLQALACYESQFSPDPRMGCWPHFLRDQMEYYA
jgi:LmbE family N-acetylglucosaminyl deacetylase